MVSAVGNEQQETGHLLTAEQIGFVHQLSNLICLWARCVFIISPS
jgi:hypothetical protein